MSKLNRFDGFGQRSDLIDLDQDAVGDPLVDAALQAIRVGYEQIVTHKLDLVAKFFRKLLPGVPVVF